MSRPRAATVWSGAGCPPAVPTPIPPGYGYATGAGLGAEKDWVREAPRSAEPYLLAPILQEGKLRPKEDLLYTSWK